MRADISTGQIIELRKRNLPLREIAARLGCSEALVYTRLNKSGMKGQHDARESKWNGGDTETSIVISRFPQSLWFAAREKAKTHNKTIRETMVRLIEKFVAGEIE